MSRKLADLCWLVLLAALCGCASQPDTRSLRHKQALAWSAQGESTYLGGDPERSARHYENALQLYTSIEHADGIAASLLSLAQIDLERGAYDRAQARLQIVLDNRDGLFGAEAMAGAAARSAQRALLVKQPGQAAEAAQRAQALCKGCVLEAAIINLRARAAFALGQGDAGADLAGKAAELADKARQPVEIANAKRLLGEIRLQQGDAMRAVPLLDEALALDKQLGLPGKIAADLHLLADAKDMLGQRAEAESHRSRERAIRSALEKKVP